MLLNKQIPWPVVFTFALGVIIPTACIIWYMNEAVNNERLAVKQKVSAIYQSQLETIKKDFIEYWQQHLERIEERVDSTERVGSGSEEQLKLQTLFYQAVTAELSSSLILYSNGALRYPYRATLTAISNKSTLFLEAQQLEFQEDKPREALKKYQQFQENSLVSSEQAEAIVAQARCLSKLNKPREAVNILKDNFLADQYKNDTFANGRLIKANALFRTLQIIEEYTQNNNTTDAFWQDSFEQTSKALAELLSDYQSSTMPSSQRSYLLEHVIPLTPSKKLSQLLKAEALALNFLENEQSVTPNSSSLLKTSSTEGLWFYTANSESFTALFDEQAIINILQNYAQSLTLPNDLKLALNFGQNRQAVNSVLAESPIDGLGQGWRIKLVSSSPLSFENAAQRQIELYIWTGFLIILAIIILMTLTTIYVSKQIKSSRLKNDLIATVSHELKTPLASMRLLVDTLINTDRNYDSTTHDYLHLIAKENARLTQLIDNFLTFSRMERNQSNFHFAKQSANDLSLCALDAVREKFKESGFTLTSSLLSKDQKVLADKGMLVTALINLLENAFKYSDKEKHIRFFITQIGETITFSIEDKGIGIARQHLKRIFNRFYRVDRNVTHNSDGCGLGLSIVHFIVKAHSGDISVKSELGKGSCFSIALPKAE